MHPHPPSRPRMDGRPHGHAFPDAPAVRHVVAPAAVVLALLGAYYGGGPALAALVAPAVNRELGLLEHLQAVALAAVAAAGVRAAWAARAGTPARRRGLAVALAAGALLAEELDYGRHHLALLAGRPEGWAGAPPALHNRQIGADHQLVDYLKQAANAGLALWFVAAALARGASRSAPDTALPARAAGALRRRGMPVPGPWYAATVGVYAATSQLAHALQAAAERRGAGWRPLDGNVSEFGELVVYYLLALYAFEIVRAADRAPTGHRPPAPPRTRPTRRAVRRRPDPAWCAGRRAVAPAALGTPASRHAGRRGRVPPPPAILPEPR